MREIEAVPASQRYLMVAWRMSDAAWNDECRLTRECLTSGSTPRNAAECREMLQIIERPLHSTEAPFVIIFCYADVPEGTRWDIVFDPKNPDVHETTVAVSRFAVIYHRFVTRTLSHGWHQPAVLDFPIGFPDLIVNLAVDSDGASCRHVGLCTARDYPEILRESKASM
jgi:hypothetical protein